VGRALPSFEDFQYSMTPLFSIAICCRNYEGYLLQALRSLENQTCRDFEFGFIDDHSSDGSCGVFSDWIQSSPIREQCFFVQSLQEQRGVIYGRNQIFSRASGRFFFYLDADDYLLPDFLENLKKIIGENEDRHVFQVTENRLNCATGVLSTRLRFRPLETIWDMFPKIVGDNLCYSSEAFHSVGGFSDIFYQGWEDFDFYLRVVRQYGCVPTKVRGVVWRFNKPSREFGIKSDLERQIHSASLVFRHHPETCLRGLMVYGRHVYPESISLGIPWIKSQKPDWKFRQRPHLIRHPR